MCHTDIRHSEAPLTSLPDDAKNGDERESVVPPRRLGRRITVRFRPYHTGKDHDALRSSNVHLL
jgi:hypothetical protein